VTADDRSRLEVTAPQGATPERLGLADRLRQATTDLHRRAEETGVVGAILAERCTRALYASLLRNLVPAYRALEAGLERHADSPALRALHRRELARSESLGRDLERLVGSDWESRLALLGEGARYAYRVEAAGEGSGALLIAHAYTRYLGDLGGGPLLKRYLARALGLDESCLSFYEFPEVGDLRAFARSYRVALDAAGSGLGEEDLIVEEAVAAFRLNIDLSEAVVASAPRPVDVRAG
jgi:heme oxygenase